MKLKWILIIIIVFLLLPKQQLYEMSCAQNQAIVNGQCVNCGRIGQVVNSTRTACRSCPQGMKSSPDGTLCNCDKKTMFWMDDGTQDGVCLSKCPLNTEVQRAIRGGEIETNVCV